MKRILKTLTVVLMAMVAVCACAFALTACGEKKSDYNFTVVYEDGSAVKNDDYGDGAKLDGSKVNKICIQVCDTYNTGLCYEYTLNADKTLKNGKISLSQKDVNDMFASSSDITRFTFHVWNVKSVTWTNNYGLEVNGAGDYELKLTAANLGK